jgi:hypothetical protein
MAKLRIISTNVVDLSGTTVTASTTQNATTMPVTNMAKDTKSLVWRSGSTVTASTSVTAALAVNFAGVSTVVGGVILPFCNINSSTATMRVVLYTGTAASVGGTADAPSLTNGAVTVLDTGTVTCCPWNSLALPNWGSNPVGSSSYAYGGGTYARLWFTPTACTSIGIVIVDNYATSAASRYIEISRLVIGNYWAPKFNAPYGLSSTVKDLSTHDRTESGDLVTRRGPRYNAINFDLKWIDTTERQQMAKILIGNGLPKPMLVSLFPDNGATVALAEQERAHMIYGKLMTMPGVALDNPYTYSTQFDIEEV